MQLLNDAGVEQPVELRRIGSDHDATRAGFLGSPTVRVDVQHVEPADDAPTDFGTK